jgi:anaerobic C4-dicarboxylate transporter
VKRDTAEGIALATGTAAVIATAFAPRLLGNNSFLAAYVTHEILSLLAVTMTITFASVANIHLSITRAIQTAVPDQVKRAEVEAKHGTPMRKEINSSAWLLFWTFLITFIAVLVKGTFSTQEYVLSLVHGVGVVATIINLLVIRDIYRTTFYMASDPASAGVNADDKPA